MIRSILVDGVCDDIITLERILSTDFPIIQISGKATTMATTQTLVTEINPELLIINIDLILNNGITLHDYFSNVNYECIFLTDAIHFAVEASNCNSNGYLSKPVQKEHLSKAINKTLSKIGAKNENAKNKILAEKYTEHSSNEDVIGIPTIEGFEFIAIKEIIQCEGLQKCTRVITTERTDIISSYNLGEFRKLLEPYGFYCPHKSHLINLKHIKKYHREGNILMINNTYVPIARRKKGEFLSLVKRF